MEKKAAPSRTYAVLTGDIVSSTGLEPGRLREVRLVITQAAGRSVLTGSKGKSLNLTFSRGDSWQLLPRDPRLGLRAALLIKALLLSRLTVDTRISIGIGTLDRRPVANLALSTGEPFTLSGRALDRASFFDITGALPERSGVMVDWFSVVLHMCSGIASEWTRRQAEIVGAALSIPTPTHERIARSLKPAVKKQTVTESLDGAGWRSLVQALSVFEKTDWSALTSVGSDSADENRPKTLSSRKH